METIDQESASERLDCVVDRKVEEKEKDKTIGDPISCDKIKTWFSSLVNLQDFLVCENVQNRISFKIEENFAIKLTRKKDKTNCYTGKVQHISNQTFHIHDSNIGEVWIEFDIADFYTWDFDVTNTRHEIQISDNGRKSIIFPVTHLWIDLNTFSMEFYNKNVIVCRKTIELPWFLSKWVIYNALTWALKTILNIGKPGS